MLYSAKNQPYKLDVYASDYDKLDLNIYEVDVDNTASISHPSGYTHLIEITKDGLPVKSVCLNNEATVVNDIYVNWGTYNDGKILVAGTITSGSTTYNGLFRLNEDFSLDTGFTIGTGFNGAVLCIEKFDNRYLIGGDFTTYNGVTVNRIVCLNYDGSISSGFNVGTGFNNSVNVIKKTNYGIYIGGNFTTYKGVTVNRIVCLNYDGSIDSGFNVGTGFDNIVLDILTIDDGFTIYVIGLFDTYSGLTHSRLIKLKQDGTVDTTFKTNLINSNYAYFIIGEHYINNIVITGTIFQYYDYTINNGFIVINENGDLINQNTYEKKYDEYTSAISMGAIPETRYSSDILLQISGNTGINLKSIYTRDLTSTFNSDNVIDSYDRIKHNDIDINYTVDTTYLYTKKPMRLAKNGNIILAAKTYNYVNYKDETKKIYSGVVYKTPNTSSFNIDIQPYIVNILDQIDFYENHYPYLYGYHKKIYYEIGNNDLLNIDNNTGLINISHLQLNSTNNYNSNEFNKLYGYLYNNFYIPKKPYNKYIRYSESSGATDRIFNKLMYREKYINGNYRYEGYNQFYNLVHSINRFADNGNSINYYNYFDYKNDSLTLYSGDTLGGNNYFTYYTNLINSYSVIPPYNGEKYGATEVILDGISYWYFFEFVCDPNDEKVMLFWLNKNYAYDYIPMNKKLVKSIKTKRNQFETNDYFPINNYLNESEVYLDLNSDLLKNDEYKLLADIIDSPSVFIVYTDDFNNVINKQVILDTDTFVFKKYKNDEMFNFSVKVKFADNEYRI